MSRHSPECSGSIAMILLRQMRSIMVRSRESNGVGRTRGRARIAFPDPAGGAGQNWRADRSSTTRSISAADRRITAHRDPIARTTKVNPLGIYSGSKAAGGRPVCEAVATHMILRTAWIYGAHGQNLVKAILRLAGERPRLRRRRPARGRQCARGTFHF
jgi:dTDP-4-dehydrorhamnose reductase